MTATRTDIHSPNHLRTEDYRFLAVYQAHANSQWDDAARIAKKRERAIATHVTNPGRRFANVHPDGQCDHCGARLNYTGLLLHVPTNEVIQVGQDCLDNRFALATTEFKAVKKAAEAARAEHRIVKAAQAWAAENADLAFLLDRNAQPEGSFFRSLADALRKYGSLTPRQAEVSRKSLQRNAEKTARKAAEARIVKVTAPTGKGITFEGIVVSARSVEVTFGYQTSYVSKAKVEVKTDGGVYTVWGTIPAAQFDITPVQGLDELKGQTVRWTAELVPSGDPTHVYTKRPRLAK